VILKLAFSVGLMGNATNESETTRTSTTSKAIVRRLGILMRDCGICSAVTSIPANYKIISDTCNALKTAFLIF
jgi:hypothetical protein